MAKRLTDLSLFVVLVKDNATARTGDIRYIRDEYVIIQHNYVGGTQLHSHSHRFYFDGRYNETINTYTLTL